jgi:hypothetical protein
MSLCAINSATVMMKTTTSTWPASNVLAIMPAVAEVALRR